MGCEGARGRVLVVAGSPQVASAGTLREAARGCGAVVAVDRGLDAVLAAGLSCDLFCGDADTVSAEGAALAASGELAAERYDPHKDDTDLGLALGAVRARWGAVTVRATCASGGRPDHLLGVLGRLAAWEGPVELAEDGMRGRVLRAGEAWEIEGAAGAAFSVVPLSPGTVLSERGMRWELDRAPVALLSDLGISNVVEAPRAEVSCHEGCAVVYLFG